MNRKRIIVVVGILAVVGILSWYFWKRRKMPFEDYGRADWSGDTTRQTLSLKTSHKPIVKVGDTIDIVFDNASVKYPSMAGKAEVVQILTPSQSWNKESYWIVTDKPHNGSGPQETGKYRLA